MAFATYVDLQNGISSWLNREDQEVLDRIPDFITFGENNIFRHLRCRHNEVELVYDIVATPALDNTSAVDLPEDFKEVKTVQYDGRMLQRKTDQWLLSLRPDSASGVPIAFARIGTQLRWAPSADENANVTLWYYNQQEHISDSEVPALYLEAPELYLFGALLEAVPFLKATDMNTVAMWQQKYDHVFGQLMGESWRADFAGSTMTVSSVGNSPDRYYGNDLTQ